MRPSRPFLERGVPLASSLLVVAVVACSTPLSVTSPDPDAGFDGQTNRGNPSQCSWPESLGPKDAATAACRDASRYFLSCQAGDLTRDCLSNDPARCPGDLVDASVCINQCRDDEFAIVCGTIGPSSVGDPGKSPTGDGDSQPPPGCGPPFITPGGIAFYCCPCGS